MEDHQPGSAAAASASLALSGSNEIVSLASLAELDSKTIATLINDVRKHGRIVQWSSVGVSALLIGWSLGDMTGLIPSGIAYVSITACVISFVAIGGVFLSQHRNWLRECTDLGMSKKQARDLRRRINAAQRQLYPKPRQMTEEEQLERVVQLVQNQSHLLARGKD